MRKLFIPPPIIIGLAAFILFSCQKELSTSKESDSFNPSAAKEWYYATFKKSAEWQGSVLKGNKLPDWKNGIAGKIGNNDVVEFPLVKKNKSFSINPVSNGRQLTQAELMRLSNASLSRIAFAKEKSGKIAVREIDYIPDWDYLTTQGFDISGVSILNTKNNFSGKVIVKTWGGSTISSLVYKDGKIIKTGKKVAANQPMVETGNCTMMQYCIWQQDCTMTFYADGLIITECTPWYNTGECWNEEVCEGEIDPCLAFGMNCDPGGGNNEDPNELPELRNNCTDPCIKDMVDNAINSNCQNKITSFINSTFANNDIVHLVFYNNNLGTIGSTITDAYTVCGTLNNGDTKITITLNSSPGGLHGSTDEYIAATIFHESLHAWIMYTSSSSTTAASSHELIASPANILLQQNAILEMFPSMPPQDAYDLAWGGLKGTQAYANLPQNTRTRIEQTNLDYRNQTKGTPC